LRRPTIHFGVALLALLLAASTSEASDPPTSPSAGFVRDAGTTQDAQAATTSASQLALNEALAALASVPPNRDGARRALERASTVDDDAMATSEAYFRLGVIDEEEGAFERALANQRSCMERAPYGSWARSARLRIGWISARSEGAFEPLARLQRVRGDPKLGGDRAAVEALARDADSFPPGRVRAEARMFAAEALARTKGAEEEAMAL
jgi:hypothetical protein